MGGDNIKSPEDYMTTMNSTTINATINTTIGKIMNLTGIRTLKFRLEKVLQSSSMKEVEEGLDKLVEERATIYAHVSQEDGVVKAINLMKEEGILADVDALAVSVAGLGIRTSKKLISVVDGMFEHTEDEAKWLHAIRDFYGGVRKIADTIVEKGLEVAKMLIKGIWAILKKAISFIISIILKAVNKVKSLVATKEEEEDDLDDFDLEEAVNMVNDGFEQFAAESVQ